MKMIKHNGDIIHIINMNVFFAAARQRVFFTREYLFPFGCSVCGTFLVTAAEAWNGLCDICLKKINGDLEGQGTEKKCDYCGRPLVSELARCMPCRRNERRAYDRAVVLFPYTGMYRLLLAAYKFGKNPAPCNFFAEKIKATVTKGNFGSTVVIVPVPPRPGKIRKIGWDQVDYLAKLLEKDGMSVSRCLKRLPSRSQKELGRENRRTNLLGRMVTVTSPPETAVIIDDVMTTGATLDSCAAALKAAGSRKVYGLCLFYD